MPASLSAHPLVFVLVLHALAHRILPLLLVAVPRCDAPRLLVGLARIGALLVADRLRALAAAGEHESCGRGNSDDDGTACASADHDLVPPAAAGGGVPLPGGNLYAVAQPHTSAPLPRRSTRS